MQAKVGVEGRYRLAACMQHHQAAENQAREEGRGEVLPRYAGGATRTSLPLSPNPPPRCIMN